MERESLLRLLAREQCLAGNNFILIVQYRTQAEYSYSLGYSIPSGDWSLAKFYRTGPPYASPISWLHSVSPQFYASD